MNLLHLGPLIYGDWRELQLLQFFILKSECPLLVLAEVYALLLWGWRSYNLSCGEEYEDLSLPNKGPLSELKGERELTKVPTRH